MECIKCKQPLQDDFLYCPYCGKKQASERKHKKRANNTGSIYKRPGNRTNPWQVKKNNVYIGTYPTRAEAQKALDRLTDTNVTDKYNLTFKEVYDDMVQRDYNDSHREIAPLKQAEDAVLLDTTGFEAEQSLELILKTIKERI